MFQKKEMIMKRKKKNRVDNGLRTLQISKAMQTRFRLIPDHLLNDVVVAGIQDMKYIDARIGKYGKPIGMCIFNNRHTLSIIITNIKRYYRWRSVTFL